MDVQYIKLLFIYENEFLSSFSSVCKCENCAQKLLACSAKLLACSKNVQRNPLRTKIARKNNVFFCCKSRDTMCPLFQKPPLKKETSWKLKNRIKFFSTQNQFTYTWALKIALESDFIYWLCNIIIFTLLRHNLQLNLHENLMHFMQCRLL